MSRPPPVARPSKHDERATLSNVRISSGAAVVLGRRSTTTATRRASSPSRLKWWLLGAVFSGVLVTVLRLQTMPAPPAPRPPRLPAAPAVTASPWAPPSSVASSSVVIYAVTHPAPPAHAKLPTLERLAADAVHAGDRVRAAALYVDLASRDPQNPAFAEAARLLSR